MLQYNRIDFSEGIDVKKQMRKKDICFVIIGILKILAVNLNLMFLIGCHDIL